MITLEIQLKSPITGKIEPDEVSIFLIKLFPDQGNLIDTKVNRNTQVIGLRLDQDELTDEQSHWLFTSDYAVCFIDSFQVTPIECHAIRLAGREEEEFLKELRACHSDKRIGEALAILYKYDHHTLQKVYRELPATLLQVSKQTGIDQMRIIDILASMEQRSTLPPAQILDTLSSFHLFKSGLEHLEQEKEVG